MAAPSVADSETTDWSSTYAQFFARSTAQSVRTLKLYQEAMEHIALGKLSPTVFQDYLPRFGRRYGTEYAVKLAEIGARFLGDLLGSGTVFSRDRASGSAAAFETEISPPRFDPVNPARWYEQLAEYAAQLNARAMKIYRAQLERVAAGESSPMEEQREASSLLAKEMPAYLQRLSQLSFDLLNRLNDVRADYEDAYFRGLLEMAKPEETAHPKVILNLSGPLRGTASAGLSITNTTGEKTAVTYSVTEVRRLDGHGPAFAPKLSISPAVLELDPDQERSLELTLKLEEQDYLPGTIYVGMLFVRGVAGLRVEVELRIMAASEVHSAPAAVPVKET